MLYLQRRLLWFSNVSNCCHCAIIWDNKHISWNMALFFSGSRPILSVPKRWHVLQTLERHQYYGIQLHVHLGIHRWDPPGIAIINRLRLRIVWAVLLCVGKYIFALSFPMCIHYASFCQQCYTVQKQQHNEAINHFEFVSSLRISCVK